MTDSQVFFYVGKKRIDYLNEKEKTEGLTYSEREERDQILQMLLGKIIRYGIDLAKKRMDKYRKDTDAYQDVQQALAEIFFEKLPRYDPMKATPTTYFRPYFSQVITEYVLQYSQHMSQYDAHNVSIVRKAAHYFEEQGVRWDEPMIATKTGLSPKVVKRTLQLAETSIRASVEESLNMASNEPTPEEQLLKNEKTALLYHALKNTLSQEDLEFFLYKVNLEGKERTFQQVADELGMQIRDVKRRYSGIIARLNANRDLQAYDTGRTGGAGSITVSLHNPTLSRKDESLFFSGLGGMPLHNGEQG